jgi:hypothetical protein
MKPILNFILIACLGLLTACQADIPASSTDVNPAENSTPNNLSPNKASLTPITEKEAFDVIPEGMYRNLNAKLAASSKKMSAKEIVKMYYPAEISDNTSFEKIKVQTEKKGTQTIVTLTHDNQSEHILIQGHRIVMTLEQKDAHWQIVSMQQQYKCWIRKEGALWSNGKCS